jgi:hypothetical protein
MHDALTTTNQTEPVLSQARIPIRGSVDASQQL